MKHIIKYTVFSLLLSIISSCEDEYVDNSINYIALESGPVEASIEAGQGSTTADIVMYSGNISSSDRSYNVIVDEISTTPSESYSLPTSVTIPAGTNTGVFTMNLNEDGLDFVPTRIVLRLEDTANSFISSRSLAINVTLICPTPSILSFEFDGFASEVTWQINDSDGNTLASGGGYSDGLESAQHELCLFQGETYTFTLNDSFGDGLSFPNNGSATITSFFDGSILASVSGDYGSQYTQTFTVQ